MLLLYCVENCYFNPWLQAPQYSISLLPGCHFLSLSYIIRALNSIISLSRPIIIVLLSGAYFKDHFTMSEAAIIPHGNLSLSGFYETESSIEVVLEKVLDVTHFRVSVPPPSNELLIWVVNMRPLLGMWLGFTTCAIIAVPNSCIYMNL